VALEAEVADLSGRLEARTLVDRAKARLQADHGLTEAEAFRFVQRASMDSPPEHARRGPRGPRRRPPARATARCRTRP
jgi:hypothetical protein